MHIIIGLLGLAAGAYFWFWRIRAATEVTKDVLNVANDVRLAARRFGFKAKTKVHPVECIDDARVAAAGIMAALLAKEPVPNEAHRQAVLVQMQTVFDISKSEAEELAVLGHWLVTECGTPSAAVTRMARRLEKLAGNAALPDLRQMIHVVFADDSGTLPDLIADALHDIQSKFRMN